MAAQPFTCGIVVPVRDEARTLPQTVPALLAATEGETARIVWVCNACRDASARLIREQAGPDAAVLEIATPGKTVALQAGDLALDAQDLFPRLYLDADTWLRPGDVGRLLEPLRQGQADLVAAAHAFDLASTPAVSAAMARCWLSLPFAQEAAMLGAVGISRAGRARWGTWPRITADDMFMAATIPRDRQQIVATALATTRPPATWGGWINMRARWLRGERQLQALGRCAPAADGQRAALVRRLLQPRTFPGAFAFCLARVLATPLAWAQTDVSWRPDRQASPAAPHGA